MAQVYASATMKDGELRVFIANGATSDIAKENMLDDFDRADVEWCEHCEWLTQFCDGKCSQCGWSEG